MSGNKPFAGPRVALPSHFPKSFRNSQPDNPCRYLITKLSDQSISSSDFFTQLLSIKNDNREISFSILNCLLFYILNCKPYHSQFCPQFTALFTKLIQNPSEPVRRSVLPLISILINNNTILKSLSNEFNDWKDESKEIFLSFAFCFQPPEVFEWKPFLHNAKESTKSDNESLSCTANDFIQYMNYFTGKERSEPKVRNSLDLTKEQFRRSMSLRSSMEFAQNQIVDNYNENEEEMEFESSDHFAIDNYFPENIKSSSSRSSQNSEIKSLRVSKQKSAMEELENDPFNKKSPFFDSIENDQDESNINVHSRNSNESDSQEEHQVISSSRSNKPQVIDSVDLSKFKNENVRKSSKNQPSQLPQHHRSKTGSSTKSRKDSGTKSSKSKLPSSIDIDVEIDDTNIEIDEIGFDEKTASSSSNLSGILDEYSLDLPSQLPNIPPQKARQSQEKNNQSRNSQNDNLEKKQKSQVSSSVNNESQKKSSRSHQSSSDAQTLKPIIGKSSKQSQKSVINNYNQSSETNSSVNSNNESVSFASQPARPPSARRGRPNNSSSSDLPKKNSQLNFVDVDGVEDSGNSGSRINSKLPRIRNSDKSNISKKKKKNAPNSQQNVEFDYEDDDDDEYSDDLFGGAPDYENKVTFSNTPETKVGVSSSANISNNRQTTKKKPARKSGDASPNQIKSGSSKTMSPVKKRPDSRGSNSSTELRQSPSNSFINDEDIQSGNGSVSNFVSSLKSKDWEQQQKGVEGLRSILSTKPGLVLSLCREAWLNLLDVITSPRSMLSKSALQLAQELFTQFSSQLVPQSAPFVDICLNLCCNSRQFIADEAENVIILIAQESHRNKVLNSFIKGTAHKNSIARGKAAQCLSILIEQGPLDDRELKAVVQCLVPLVRDNRTETRSAAKETLKLVADDDRFRDIAKDVCKNSVDYKELLKSMEI